MVDQPLSGVRIIDLCHEWAGPHAGRLMADFGAEVVKVEYIRRLDIMRGGYKEDRKYDRNPRFLQLNRNKRSLTLDLHDTVDRGVFEDLVRCSDVVLSNSRPGVLERLGFAYMELKTLKPDIILVSLSACGRTGPEAAYAGYGGGIEATSGIQGLTAYTRDGEPRRIREMDVTNGVVGSSAILTALVYRQQTGSGTWIDLSEMESPAHALIGEHLLEYATNGNSTLPVGNRHPTRAPHGCYPCRGEDAWLVVSVGTEEQWAAICAATDHLEWSTDRRFATAESRMQHHDELDDLISAWSRQHTKFDAMERLQRAAVPAGAVLDVADLHADPHLRARSYFRRPSQEPSAPPYAGFPFRLSVGGGEVVRPGPALGEANREITCDWLKRPADDAREISEDGIRTEYDVE